MAMNALKGAIIALGMVAVLWFFHWTMATSGGFGPPGDEDYYNFMVRGWRQGHLYMSKAPTPAMLALSDPYDPDQNRDVRLADASYFRGHYYLYFGAAPAAVLLLPYDLVTGRELGTTTAIFVFCVIGYLASSALWLLIRSRYFPASSAVVGVVGVLLLGLGTHVLALQRRALVWELPISMGYAFSMLGLLGLYFAVHGRKPALAFGLAGFALGMAVAARPTCIFGAVMFIPPLWSIRRHSQETETWIYCAVTAACGFGIWLSAIFAFNFARFGNPLEFGQNYQLSGVYESKMHHFSFTYIPHNFFLYFFHPGTWSFKFPFVSTAPVAGGPPGYLGNWSEAICGLGVTFPYVWMALALPLALRKGDRPWRLRCTVYSIAAYCSALCLVVLLYFVATERYLADFAPTLGLLALCAWLGIEEWSRRFRWGRAVRAVAVLGGLASAVAGVFVSFDYHGRMLHTLSPAVWDNLKTAFSRFGL
jgi:hypothetical protein